MQPARNKRDTGEGLHGVARHSTRMRSTIHSLLVYRHFLHGVMPAYEFRRGFCTLVLSLCVCVCVCIRLFPL